MLALRRSSRLVSCLSRCLSALRDIESNALHISQAAPPKQLLPQKDLVFGRTFSDHMLTVEWNDSAGWLSPMIRPYAKLELDPSCSVFHYGMECFEGMKAYKDNSANIRLFRPDMNMQRLHRSATRLTLPTFDQDQLLACIMKLLKVDERWIPTGKGYSLYLRPTMIATQPTLGVGPSSNALLFVIASPVGPYFKTGFKAISLLAQSQHIRAWPGGTGDCKIGGNYAPTILTQATAASKGYQQILWLFGKSRDITEVGTMNCFIYLTNEKGEHELVTPPLDGTILPGVTRDSILQLARQWNEFEVSERKITMDELLQLSKEKRLHEMFGAGTACIVSPIHSIHFEGQDINVPLNPKDSTSEAGPLTKRFNDTILGIQYGEIKSDWSVLVK